MTDVIEQNDAEREKLLPVALYCFAGYVTILLIGRIVGGMIF
ncbi:MAG: hypothetical protein OXU66_11245 [Gammaproteobacteria bacterium]|nr:hypothetical protein [Gammaproteobacteria bacterium]MDD9895123.1 hypothetical protein [Gammaproteobacteria bacterium]MDD9959505.1 hypothetical protein [Gammaproteobacteria bacterium]